MPCSVCALWLRLAAHLEGLPPPEVAAVEGALVGHLALGAVQRLVLFRLPPPRRRRRRVACRPGCKCCVPASNAAAYYGPALDTSVILQPCCQGPGVQGFRA